MLQVLGTAGSLIVVGAGKTTLLRNLLANDLGRDTILINTDGEVHACI